MKYALAVTACLLTTSVAAFQQQPVFSSRVEAVRLEVLVTRNGELVSGLTPNDFEVRDNGVLQDITLVAADELPLNVVLAFDVSESMKGNRLRDLQNAGRALLDALDADDGAALVTFGNGVTVPKMITIDRATVREALDQAASGGPTALIDGCFSALMLGSVQTGRSLALVFSDGVDTASWLTADAVLSSARRANVVTYAVVPDGPVREPFLRDLAAATGGDVLRVKATTDVRETFLRVLNEHRQRYLLSYVPNKVSTPGWHRLDVRVKRPGASVRTRPGYMAGR